MRFHFVEQARLPRLAWCARVARGSEEVVVACGRDVETGPERFFEGAWSAPFAGSDPAAASVVCGTAGVLRPGAVAFVASSDRLSPVFSVEAGDARFVSNSPVFAASAAQASPDPIHPFYPYDWLALWRAGRFAPDGTLPLAGGRRLHVHLARSSWPTPAAPSASSSTRRRPSPATSPPTGTCSRGASRRSSTTPRTAAASSPTGRSP